ncbi:MAG TPA: proline racemase family protein [Symbiobacteriaceae bacterium]|jgi:proline racemase
MRFTKLISTIDSHTGGNPTRTIIGGAVRLAGRTMSEKMLDMKQNYDWLRQVLMYEPRGHEVMSGCVLTEPCDPTADLGVVFIETGGYLPMCGHDTIGLCTAAVEAGLVRVTEPITAFTLDTPAGLVRVNVTVRDGKAIGVTFRNVPSFLQFPDLRVQVPGFGTVTVDVAYGGNYYCITNAEALGLELTRENGSRLIRTGVAIREAVNRTVAVQHPEAPFIRGATHVEFYGPPTHPEAHQKNVVIIPPGGIDRSPCGTGTAAKVATLVAKGQLKLGEEFVHESIVGSIFRARAVEKAHVGDLPAVVSEITGQAWITGFHQFVLDPADEIKNGFLLM